MVNSQLNLNKRLEWNKMVNYTLHENGWTVIIQDLDLRTATQDDINHIARLIATNTLVVVKKQNLTIQDEVRIAKMFKNPQVFDIQNSDTYVSTLGGASIPGSEGLYLRVSGEKNDDGEMGLGAHVSEMIWHCNDPGFEHRHPIIWLYGVKGTKGSRTTYNNNILSYNDLDENVKQELDNYHLEIFKEASLDADNPDPTYEISNFYPKLVRENIAGKKGMFFPFLQVVKVHELSDEKSKELIDWLGPHTVQEKYCYHHDWDDGDALIAEQNLGIHKRWRFENIYNRVLHRGAFDFPDQDYK